MKRFLTILTALCLTSTITANAAESQIQNYVNKKLSPLVEKEMEFNAKLEAQQKASAEKKAEQEKALEAKKAELAAKKAELEKKQKENEESVNNIKKSIEAEKSFWKKLLSK